MLATSNPDAPVHQYLPFIAGQLRYWQQIEADAVREASGVRSMVMANISHTTVTLLNDSLQQTTNEFICGTDPDAYGRARSFLLGMTAISVLVRKFAIGDMEKISDGIGEGTANFIFDTYNNPRQPPKAPRLHMPPDIAEYVLNPPPDGTSLWYESPGLYVHYNQPALPTSEQQAALVQHNISVDFDPLVTLTPHLRRQ